MDCLSLPRRICIRKSSTILDKVLRVYIAFSILTEGISMKTKIGILLTLAIFCTSCAPVTEEPSPIETATSDAKPHTSNTEIVAIVTVSIEADIVPSTETITPSPIPASTLITAIEIVGISFPSGQLMVSMNMPIVATENYFGKIGENTYKCFSLDEYPNRLYCTGPILPSGDNAILEVFNPSADKIFAVSFIIPDPNISFQENSKKGCGPCVTTITTVGDPSGTWGCEYIDSRDSCGNVCGVVGSSCGGDGEE